MQKNHARIKLTKVLCVLFLSFLSQKSFALISGQAMIGIDSSTVEIDSTEYEFSGSSLGAALHLDPIPLIPIGFGVEVHVPTTKVDDRELTGVVVDLQVSAWAPVGLFGIKPFAKVGYIPFGVYNFVQESLTVGTATEQSDVPFTSSGLHFAGGIYYSFLPLISLLAQYSMREETLSMDGALNLAGIEIDADDLPERKRNSQNFMFGVEIGI